MAINIERPTKGDVTLDLTVQLQALALTAWRSALPHRTEAELRYVFNPSDERQLSDTQRLYRGFAQSDGLLLAYRAEELVGFSLAKNDVSGSLLGQIYKRAFERQKIYALLRHICVAPEVQGNGYGKHLAVESLAGFRNWQVPTAYVLAENPSAQRFFETLGFHLEPPAQEPAPKPDYFGPQTVSALQNRYAAPSIEHVLKAVA